MKPVLAFLILASMALAGCATVSPRIAAGRSLVASEGAFDAAVVSAAVAINTGALLLPVVKALHADADAGRAMKDAVNATYAAGGTPDIAAQSAALTGLAAQITSLLPKAKP